ncbi:branched-chain amino acid ABC transporter permease [Salipiger sp. P9]|uniref:branched-chain amino acid ABC transporter permease n=1 Tax=Salipiger pentaromativorans TaxID=2943193 RepID=UPI0021584A4A|nr:branched-chain amino acid ABC transporter permease [Salipiger pentaromativorans]MCR8549429.1 branched-chain amino acid ABC transporter permease [Salipiger pentaromativorans]
MTDPKTLWAAVSRAALNWKLLVPLAVALELFNRLSPASSSTLLTEVAILALFATSLNLLMSFGHMVSFGHAAYFGLGAYGFTLAVTRGGLAPEMALLVGPLAAALGGLVFGALCVRLTEIYFAMLTLACAQITYTVLFQWYDVTGGDTGITGFMIPRLGLSETGYASLVLGLVALALLALWMIVKSPLGLMIRAVGQDRARAEALGLAARRVQLVAFVIAAFFAGIAGTLYAVLHGSAFPDYAGLGLTLDGLIMVVLGGLNSFAGGIWGAVIYEMLSNFVPKFIHQWELVLGLLLLGICLAMPHGFAGLLARLGWRGGKGEK